ncbi:MAG TPA: methylated-DNA--[protein]-cysteine S-methyltransferase [Kiritimatiellia bacterium]|nr:methylated-DNA--[protein]-cysteine S-methyltransferase [Kiritimatiellia bacterium]
MIKKAEAFVRDILSGQSVKPPPVTFPEGTPVQNEVWRVLHAIPFGKVMTYGEVARKIGRPRAARSVGQACGANLIPLIIPCHRVVGSGGALGGFSGGLAWKKQLLQMEKWQSRSASVRRTAR